MRKHWMMIAILLLAAIWLTAGQAEKRTETKTLRAGNSVLFGTYEQDDDTDNGPEPIEWIVLDVQDGKALLLSRYGLEQMIDKDSYRSTDSWETCVQREWLNGTFYDSAFTETEKSAILLTDVDNSDEQGSCRS